MDRKHGEDEAIGLFQAARKYLLEKHLEKDHPSCFYHWKMVRLVGLLKKENTGVVMASWLLVELD